MRKRIAEHLPPPACEPEVTLEVFSSELVVKAGVWMWARITDVLPDSMRDVWGAFPDAIDDGPSYFADPVVRARFDKAVQDAFGTALREALWAEVDAMYRDAVLTAAPEAFSAPSQRPPQKRPRTAPRRARKTARSAA